MYSMDNLVKTFSENADLYKAENDKMNEQYKRDYPDTPMPDWVRGDFCINTALASICREILHLKTLGNSEGWIHKG